MSILYVRDDGWIISHEMSLQTMYKETLNISQQTPYSFNSDLFLIINPFKTDAHAIKTNGRKRKLKNNQNFSEEVEYIRKKLESFISESVNIFGDCTNDTTNNLKARMASKLHFETIEKKLSVCNGGNENNFPIIVDIFNRKYIIPSKCEFFCCDIFQLKSKLREDQNFDFILLDPPWWNKYIRRKRRKIEEEGYKMMTNSDISKLPVGTILKKNGLVAIWCTNAASHLNAIKEEIFPAWGLQYISSWYWIKVTKKGETVCQFSEPPGKQPYERIVFGSSPERCKTYSQPEENKILISVPSAIHSHKPPLGDIIGHYLTENPSCLELFARYLLPGWTSCGDQVLSLQDLGLYTVCSTS